MDFYNAAVATLPTISNSLSIKHKTTKIVQVGRRKIRKWPLWGSRCDHKVSLSIPHGVKQAASATQKFSLYILLPNSRALAQPREAAALLRQQKNYSNVKKEKGLDLPWKRLASTEDPAEIRCHSRSSKSRPVGVVEHVGRLVGSAPWTQEGKRERKSWPRLFLGPLLKEMG